MQESSKTPPNYQSSKNQPEHQRFVSEVTDIRSNQMERKSESVDIPSTTKGQNEAQNVESTLSSQTTKVMKNLEAVLETVLMMKDLETDTQSIPLITRCIIVLKRISDLEMDLQCHPIKERAMIVYNRIIGQNVGGSAECSHRDFRTGEQININYFDLVMKNLEAVLETALLMKDPQSIPLIKGCMIVFKRIGDLKMDLQCLPIKKRAMIVRNRIGQNVSGSATCSHHDFRMGEQININAPISPNQKESNLHGPAKRKQPSDDNHQDCNDALNQLAVYNPADSASDGTDSRPSQNQAYRIVPYVGAYVTQCSICFKWRFLPSKEMFEEICENNSEQPFVCAGIREWHPDISCNEDTDLTEDGNWAIEKQNIPRPPLGWERILKIRSSGGDRFADVYYFPPSGVRLRSTADVKRYLDNHPDEAEGIALSQFSFQSPRLLLEY